MSLSRTRARIPAALLGLGLVCGVVAAPAQAQVTTQATNIYVATPATGCNDANDGTRANRAVCTFTRAEVLANNAYNAGARGDVFVRVKSGKAAQRTPQSRGETTNFTFAPAAGTTVYIVPDWYQPGLVPDPKAGRDYVYWRGNDTFDADKAKGNVANHYALNVSPRENRGGAYYVAGHDVSEFVKGIIVNGRIDSVGSARDKLGNKGTLLPYSAPMQDLVIERNRFHEIGSKYANAYSNDGKHIAENGNAALHFWNTVNTRVTDNSFNNVYNTIGGSLGHIIYANAAAYATVENNSFSNSNLTAVHRRISHAWDVKNNTYGAGLTAAHISTWYRGSNYNNDGRLAECRYGIGTTDSSKVREYSVPQQSWCTDSRRIYAPREVRYTVSPGQVTANWTPAVTNGQKVAKYVLEVTDYKDNVIASVEVGPDARQARVPLARPGLRVGLVAYGASGHHTGASTLRLTTDTKKTNYTTTVRSWDRPMQERRGDDPNTAAVVVASTQDVPKLPVGSTSLSSSSSSFGLLSSLLRMLGLR